MDRLNFVVVVVSVALVAFALVTLKPVLVANPINTTLQLAR